MSSPRTTLDCIGDKQRHLRCCIEVVVNSRRVAAISVKKAQASGIDFFSGFLSSANPKVPYDVFGLIGSPPHPFQMPLYIEAHARFLVEAPSPISVVKKTWYDQNVRKYIDDDALFGSETSSSDHDGFLS